MQRRPNGVPPRQRALAPNAGVTCVAGW